MAHERPKPAGGEARSDLVQSLERGMAVIRTFSSDTPSLTISEVAARTGLTRATARRILHTLVHLDYARLERGRFSLTPKILDLGYSYLSSLPLSQVAEPHMRSLAERLRESTSGAILEGTEVVYVARVQTHRIMTVALAIGSRLPAYCTSLGRVLLAHLPETQLDRYLATVALERLTSRTVTEEAQLRKILQGVRTRGWALVDQELEDGVRSVAAPIRDRDNQVVAALNISGHAGRTSLKTLRREFLPELMDTADKITLAMR